MSPSEQIALETIVDRLNLNPDDEKAIIEAAYHKARSRLKNCPHCNKPLNIPYVGAVEE